MDDHRIITGYEAIEFAQQHGGTLCKCADPTEDDRDDLTPDQAREVAREDPSLIYTYAPAEHARDEWNEGQRWEQRRDTGTM